MSVNMVVVDHKNKRKSYSNQYCYGAFIDHCINFVIKPKYVELYFNDSGIESDTLRSLLIILTDLFTCCEATRGVVKHNTPEEIRTSCKVRVNINGQKIYPVFFVLWTFRLLSNNRSAVGNFGRYKEVMPLTQMSDHRRAELIKSQAKQINLIRMIYGLTYLTTEKAILQLVLYQHGAIYGDEDCTPDICTENCEQHLAVSADYGKYTYDELTKSILRTNEYNSRTVISIPFTSMCGQSWSDFLNSMYRSSYSPALMDCMVKEGVFNTLDNIHKEKNGLNTRLTYDNMAQVMSDKSLVDYFSGEGISHTSIQYVIHYASKSFTDSYTCCEGSSMVRNSYIMSMYSRSGIASLDSYKQVA